LSDDAIYKLYQSAQKHGDTHGASKYFDLLIAHGKGDMRGKALFDLAYPLFKKGDYKKALSWLDKIISGDITTDESYPQALYWHGRTLEKISIKNKEKAKQNYHKLLKEFPFSFYATLAAKRLGVAAISPKLPQMGGVAPSEGRDFFALIDEMNARKLSDAAGAVMDIALNLYPDWQKTHEEYIAKKLIQSHNYRKALDMADKHFDCGVYGPVTGSSDPLFAAFYPLAYRDQTSAGYNKNSLPLGAIEGIMREESLFQRNVRSHAGAVGLMQLMPATARMMSRTVGGETLLDLTDPQSNILLGSAYLHDMKNYFGGQLPLAIMAYNAGPGNVNKWLRTVGDKELDEFIEDIPLSETRGYVKRVMRSMQVYGFLYNEPYFKKPSFNFQIQVAKK
jgi:soluble lytic murein transglycosylase